MPDLRQIAQMQESYQRCKENYVRLKTQLESLEARRAQVVESIKADGIEPESLEAEIAKLDAVIKEDEFKIKALLSKVGF
jgi:chromosome segregation ATPase